jgi:hypothetical protein
MADARPDHGGCAARPGAPRNDVNVQALLKQRQ